MVDHHSVCAQLPSRISLRRSGFSELKGFGARHDRQPQRPLCLYGEKRTLTLLPPQYQQKWRKFHKDNLRSVDLRVTFLTASNHQMQQRLARFPMMHFRIGITAYPTPASCSWLPLRHDPSLNVST